MEKQEDRDFEKEWEEAQKWPVCPACGMNTDIKTDDGMALCSTCPDVEPTPFAN